VRKEALVWNSELILVLWFYSAWIYWKLNQVHIVTHV
jgi:hypothetical protein